ncbi:MAG TPA: hypothetical protein VFO79_06525 [Xanthomonadales bacterium]|nr:hypothetical protein [Xanthomonadales bacterium]
MRTHAIPVTVLILAASAAFPARAWNDCEYREPRNLDLAADGVRTLVIRAQAGDLAVRGGPGNTVAVRGEACSSDADQLASIRLVQSRSGDTLTVAVEMPEHSGWGNLQRALDLDLTVPSRLAVRLQDSSGDVEVRGVASVTAEDSSGDLEIDAIAGDVEVRDSSGEIVVRDAGGNVRIPSDSSGDITVRGVLGSVSIEEDSSGSITIAEVGGDARVDTDSSGDIEFERITGSAEVGRDSSGAIEADDIGRDFVVRSDGSGGISHDRVRGRVDIPDQD